MGTRDNGVSKTQRTVVNGARRKAKKKVKRLHPATFAVCFLCLLLGVAIGAVCYNLVSRDDCFELRGKSVYELEVGTPFSYRDEGVSAISFGADISDKVEVQTNMMRNTDGTYTADTSEQGEYYMIYTVDSPKYEGVQKVRKIIIRGE